MSSVPQSRIYLGWAKEFFLSLLFILQWPIALFYRRSYRAGRRKETVIILTDVGASPLLYARLAGRLQQLGFSTLVFSCASPIQDVRSHSRRLAAELSERDVRNGLIIGHGMGALAALSLPDAGRQRVERLVTLGAPFHGSRLFMSAPFIPALRDMATGSEFLLLHRMNALLFTSFDPFSAWQNQWILPFNLSHFGQGRDLIFDQVGHYNLILGGDNLDTLCEFLSERYPDNLTAVDQAKRDLGESGRPGAAPGPTLARTQPAPAPRAVQGRSSAAAKKKAAARGRKR